MAVRAAFALAVFLLPLVLRAQPESPPLPTPSWVQMFDQGEADPRLQGLQTPRGVKLEIVAEHPAVTHPRQMAFGDDGTLFVLEWRPGEKREESQEVALAGGRTVKQSRTIKTTRDLLKSLHDTNGDGTFDEARVVMDDLELPSGLLIHDGWYYWTSGGRLLRRRPFDAKLAAELAAAAAEKKSAPTTATSDGKWLQQQLTSGLAGTVPFQAGGLSLGPDGWLYVAGGSGDNRAASWDGSQAAALRSGAVFRLRPDGSGVREFARGFCQPRGGVAFDALGPAFLADADWAGGKISGSRLIHVLEGGDYGWQHTAGDPARPDTLRAAAGGERAGTLPGMLRGGSAASAGLASANIPVAMLVSCDAGGHAVRGFVTRPEDATLRAAAQCTLLASGDPLFFPCQAVTGPDGALYIADWRGAGDFAAGGAAGEPNGRIYRLSWSGFKDLPAIPLASRDRWARLATDKDEELVSLLAAPDAELRRRAGQEIVQRARRDAALADKTRRSLSEVLLSEAQPVASRAAAISAAGQLLDAQLREELGSLLTHENADIVRQAADALGNGPPTKEDELSAVTESVKGALSGAADPAKLRPLQLALGKLAAAGKSVEAAEWNFESTSVTHGPKMSRYVFDGHVRALELVPGAAKELMLGNLDVALNFPQAEPLERQRIKEFVAVTAEAMRTRELAEFLDALLRGEENLLVRLEAPLEVRLLACYRNVLVDPPIQADAVAQWVEKNPGGPAEVELAALEAMSLLGVSKEGAVENVADHLLAAPASASLVARSLLAGRLDRGLLPKVKAALARHAVSDKSGEIAALLKQLEK